MSKEKKNDKKKVDIKEFATIVKGKIRDFIRHPAVRALDEMKKADAKIPPIVHDEDNLLEVQNLKQYFPLKAGFFKRTVGYVRAVDGISFNIKRLTNLSDNICSYILFSCEFCHLIMVQSSKFLKIFFLHFSID